MSLITGLLVIAGLIVGLSFGGVGPFSATATPDQTTPGQTTSPSMSLCPDSQQTSVTVTQYNQKNTGQTETYDQTARLYRVGSDGGESLFATLSQTTNTETTVNCGDTYRLRLESSDDSNARIDGVRSGDGASVSSNNRHIQFTAKGAVYNLEFDSAKRGSLLVRAFDLQNNGFVFTDTAANANSYQAAGVTFQSTQDNATATALGEGDLLDWRFDIKADSSSVDANDFGIYMLVDASTNVYEEPSVRFDGQTLQDVTGSLDTFERRAFSEFEYVYRLDGAIENRDRSLSFSIQSLADVTPTASDDIQISFAGIGAVKQTAGNSMRYAATNDASSPQAVFTQQDYIINIQ